MERPNGQPEVFARLRDFARPGRGRGGESVDAQAGVRRGGAAVEARAGIRRGDESDDAQAGVRRGASAIDVQASIRQDVAGLEQQALHGQCELCSLPLSEIHRHLFEIETRAIVCACDGCALTFQGVVDGRYRPIPRDARVVPDDVTANIPWEQMSLPINLAFFVREDEAEAVSAYYPSPGGVTKSAVPFNTVDEIFDENSVLSVLEPHVEALLVNRLTQKAEAFVVPIDQCYELTGLIRLNWRGFSGGEDVRREMNAFFDRLRSRARPIRSA